jgi:hypothetical protein
MNVSGEILFHMDFDVEGCEKDMEFHPVFGRKKRNLHVT